MEQTKKMNCFFWSWCYEDKARFFDRHSEAGWQLTKLGTRTCTFVKGESNARFRYQLAILPGKPGDAEFEAAVKICAKNRWELVDTDGVWSCLRKPYDAHLPDSAYLLPVTEQSEDRIEARFRKAMHTLVVIIAVCCVIAAGFAVWGYIRKLHLWQVAFPFGAIVVGCLIPFVKMQSWIESKGRLKPEPERQKKQK